MATLTYRLPVAPPYAWAGVCAFLARRAIPGVEDVREQTYRRVVGSESGPGFLEVSLAPGGEAVQARCFGLPERKSLESRIAELADVDADSRRIDGHLGEDPILARAVENAPGTRVPGCLDPFELGVRAIVGQQVSVAGASTISGRIAERFGDPVTPPPGFPDDLLRCFPEASVLAGSNLEGLGMPTRRAAAICAYAAAVASGEIDFSDPSADDLTRRLRSIPGVGPWTASYIAMRGLGDRDAFLENDLIVRRRMAEAGKLPTPRAARERAEAWRPYRAYAVMYLWATTP